MHKNISISLALLFFWVGQSVSSAQTLSQLNASPTKHSQTNTKVGYRLQKMIDQPALVNSSSSQALMRVKATSKVQVYVTVNNTDSASIDALNLLGLEVEIVNRALGKIQGWIDVADIVRLTQFTSVLKVDLPSYGHSRVGANLTEGDAILNANTLRNQGFTGNNTRIGIISTGSFGLTSAQGSNELPENVTTFGTCTAAPSVCAEGTAMAEIIHDIAPDAELAIGGGFSTLEFIARLDDLADNFNADIIVDDIGFLFQPYFEDGDVAQAVNNLPSNITYVSAAGNEAQQHLQNGFLPTVLTSGDIVHDFGLAAGTASNIGLPVDINPGGQACATLQWNDPFALDNPNLSAENDYDLIAVDVGGNTIDQSISTNNTLEALCIDNNTAQPTTIFFVVLRFTGVNREIEMFFFGDGFAVPNTFITPQDSVFGHPATERAIAVGTINAGEPGNNDIASFSNQGPVRIDFPIRQTRAKPDITGIDGVSVSGAGGIAALLKSAVPDASPQDIRNALNQGATDLGINGPDSIFGSGRANAQRSFEVLTTEAGNPTEVDDSSILDFLPAIISGSNRQ